MTTQAIPAASLSGKSSWRLPASSSAVWPLVAIGVLLTLQLSMVFTRAVNWDEFWFYYHVADFARGNLAQPLQSLHVRLFAWLPGLSGSGIDKILVARLLMLSCEIATLAAIYAIARRFVERPVAVLAALLYLSAGFVMQHGFSFRTDPMATAALMSALAILARSRLSWAPLAGFALLVAVAGMITMKIVLYAPAFLGLAWMRWSECDFDRKTALRLSGAAIACIAIFVALYTWHSTALTEPTAGSEMAASASRWMFFLGIPPYWQMGVKAALTAPILALLALAAPFAIWRSGLSDGAKWGLTGLWLPVSLPLFYTNTAAYFYVFMLAPVTVSLVVALKAALGRYPVYLVAAVLTIMAAGIFVMEDRDTIERQRSLVETAESLLPAGTAYFDHNGMLPSFSKANYLMTPSAIDAYEQGGKDVYLATLESRRVPLLVANDPALENVMKGTGSVLRPADTAALRETYVHGWGPLWLAGFEFPAVVRETREVRVPGIYRVEGSAILVGDTTIQPGGLIELTRGRHAFATRGPARLIWNTVQPLPEGEWKDGALYVDF